tara:strand:- start:1848 stop:1949 length:102 start_codon:yes stop_codon:yes gene_type:complete
VADVQLIEEKIINKIKITDISAIVLEQAGRQRE